MTKEMINNNQAVQAAADAVHLAAEAGRFMAAVWKVEFGRVELVNVTTYQFPTGDFLPAVGQLAANCHEEALRQQKASPPTAPLPRFPGRLNPPMRFGLVKKDGESGGEKDAPVAPETAVGTDERENPE